MPKKVSEQKTKSAVKSEKKTKVKTGLLIPLYNPKGEKINELDLPKEIFSEKENAQLLAQYVRVYRANQRVGTASTKTRSEVIGSTRKIYKQKGTGRARHGDIKAPIFVGGGVTGGPKSRDYSLTMNKKQIRKVLYMAFSLQYKNKNVYGLSDVFLTMQAKTKRIIDFLKKAGIDRMAILFLVPKVEKNNFILSVRNLPFAKVRSVTSVNAYELLKYKKILMIESALSLLKKHYLTA